MLYEQILQVSHSYFVTPAVCLYYLWAKALHVFFPEDPVVFGVTVSGRNIINENQFLDIERYYEFEQKIRKMHLYTHEV